MFSLGHDMFHLGHRHSQNIPRHPYPWNDPSEHINVPDVLLASRYLLVLWLFRYRAFCDSTLDSFRVPSDINTEFLCDR